MELHIEDPICTWAEDDGWLVRKLTYPGRDGAPDRMFIKGGRVVFIEFKDTGKPLAPLQARERKRLLAAGAEAYMVDTRAQACKILGIQDRSAI